MSVAESAQKRRACYVSNPIECEGSGFRVLRRGGHLTSGSSLLSPLAVALLAVVSPLFSITPTGRLLASANPQCTHEPSSRVQTLTRVDPDGARKGGGAKCKTRNCTLRAHSVTPDTCMVGNVGVPS